MSTDDSTSSEVEAALVDSIVATAFATTQSSFIMAVFVIMFYGGYTVLFSLYVYLQVQQRGRNHYYQIAVLLLYMLATAALVLAILAYNQENLLFFTVVFNNLNAASDGDIFFDSASEGYFTVYESLGNAEAFIYVAANIIADTLLLYRCYLVWGGRKYIVVGPFLVSFVNTALGLTAAALGQINIARIHDEITENLGQNASIKAVSAITTSFAHCCLMKVTYDQALAGRIWWLSRETRRSLGEDGKSLNSIVAIILESGSLYPVALAIGLGLTVANTGAAPEPILTAVVGMAPTLIMVRTDLGISIRISSDEKASNPPESQIPLTRFINDSTHF
ncbi:hypothetical protein BDP27DRAFT_1426362 [Rhodocollybia butyracea]|uniref:Uncharacterized protein n=1 Tax=Rhodocollybia butyracea TaxID=206335 RepID=A0A9P5PHH7_9AGAR|nr:hypothetical protein BDP27DRAFT_1426362 [Rhodocollybia butyracea]